MLVHVRSSCKLFLVGVGCGSSNNPPRASACPCSCRRHALVWRSPANRCKSLLTDLKLFLVASRCFPLRPAALRLKEHKFMRLAPQRGWSRRVLFYVGKTNKCGLTHSTAVGFTKIRPTSVLSCYPCLSRLIHVDPC